VSALAVNDWLQACTDGYTPIIVGTGASAAPQKLDGTYSATANFFTVPVKVRLIDSYRFQFTFSATGAPVGTLQLQSTIDDPGGYAVPNSGNLPAANWAPLFFSVNGAAFSQNYAITAGGGIIVLDENRCNYGWMRAAITYTSGTITPVCRWLAKGIMGR
jgi:hypothetical protein